MEFFTRIDHLNLVPGNKAAGFFLSVSVQALALLRTVSVSEEELSGLTESARLRIRRAGLLNECLIEDCDISLLEGSAVPRYFVLNPMFACSIGANPEELDLLADPEKVKRLPSELEYSPHNVDAPAQALVLLILVQTWAEWAWAKLRLVENDRKKEVRDA